MSDQQFQKVKSGPGFIAALDQSGGSTPKALQLYGIGADAFSDDDEMFALMHQMRSRMITTPSFRGDRVVGAILFEDTMGREIDGRPTTDYLWNVKGVVPFLKIDKGLAGETQGVQLMKPIPELAGVLRQANDHGVFGTKMRSFIKQADAGGVKAVVDQQFEFGLEILGAGLVPILEPEVDIHSPQKADAEALLRTALVEGLTQLSPDQYVMFKVTLPDVDDFYAELVGHAKVLRVVALSGGYTRDEANAKLARNHGVIASFSRALSEGLRVDQSDSEFDATLTESIESIYAASIT